MYANLELNNMISLKFKINDLNQTLYFIKNKVSPTILDFCLENGVYIPHFCYNKYLMIAGNCRICVVEVFKYVKPIISCLNLCVDNLNLYTNSYSLKKLRENVLEFLLINHPLDCPVCDQAGECDLQEQSLKYGLDRSRYFFKKKSNINIYLNNYIKLNLNRCILCMRCVRFLREISTSFNFLGSIGRGYFSKIHMYNSVKLSNVESSNIIDLCPVGALNLKYNQFTFRPWEIDAEKCVDIMDSFGAPVLVEFKSKKVVRILPQVDKLFFKEFISNLTRSKLSLYDDFFNYVFDPMTYNFRYRFVVDKTFAIFTYPTYPLKDFKQASLSFRMVCTKQRRFRSIINPYFNFFNEYILDKNILNSILYQNVRSIIFINIALKKYMYRFFLSLKTTCNNLNFYNTEDLNILNINNLVNRDNVFLSSFFINKFNYSNNIYLIKYLSFFKTLVNIDDMYTYSLKNLNILVKYPTSFIDFKNLSKYRLTKNRGVGHTYTTRILKFDTRHLYNLLGENIFPNKAPNVISHKYKGKVIGESLVYYKALRNIFFNSKILHFVNTIKNY
jgi:ferredoxin